MNLLAFLDRIVVPTLVIFLLIASTASTLLGLALLFRSAKAIAFMHSMNRWVSTRRAMRPAELPRSFTVESRRGKVLLALFLMFGGLFALYVLLLRIEIPRVAVVFGVDLRRWFLAGIALQTMRWFLVVGSALAVVVAVLILFFPERLVALEARLNRWYSTRHILPPTGESMRYPLDMLVEGAPRVSGCVIALASLAVAASMTVLLAARFAG